MISDIAFSIHGHFYQPSREDPISGLIPTERGAVPFNNWNELIYHHCYKPNAELRNFERISFNIGPTLFDWLEKYYPQTATEIIQQERSNYEKYGVGNALAQPYHHTILPLANQRDKITQIQWGIHDFEKRFGHSPAGMWLPEAAVDVESLQIMAGMGIEFTILAPWQADTQDLDVSQPYWVELGDDRRIGVFFYHRDISTKISFDPHATMDAGKFAAESILPLFTHAHPGDHPRFILAASDGELYGHHQTFRDKFLDHLMDGALTQRAIQHSFPALWFRQHPPQKTVKIRENTSWSCHHGVERWGNGCDCTPMSAWKGYLRQAIDEAARLVDHAYETHLRKFSKDVWQLRNDYWPVISGFQREDEFVSQKLGHVKREADRVKVRLLLRAQFERQRMYTSCAWFFDDFDRIEPQNVVAYAAQALFWAETATGQTYMDAVLPLFSKIHSQRTLVSGDMILSQQYQRAREESQRIAGDKNL